MNSNMLIFSQVMDHLPLHTFRKCVSRYHDNRYVKKYLCYEQYLIMAFSRLTHRISVIKNKVSSFLKFVAAHFIDLDSCSNLSTLTHVILHEGFARSCRIHYFN